MNLVGMLGKMLLSNAMSRRGGSGNLLGSLLGGALGGGQGGAQGGGAGLGGLLAGLAGGGAAGASAGGLLGQLTGSGGGGGLLGSMLGGSASSGGGLGSLLGAAMGQQTPDGGRTAAPPAVSEEQTRQAELLIRAMVNAAKADGTVDAEEQEKIVGKLGEIDAGEAAFIRSEMNAPLDVDGFARSVPRGLEQQVYLISLLAIDLDNQAEARYLDALRQGLGMDETTANELHREVGAQTLYN